MVIVKLSVDNIENSKRFKLILVYYKVYRVFEKFYQKIDQNFLNFKKINAPIISSKKKQFTKINTRKKYVDVADLRK